MNDAAGYSRTPLLIAAAAVLAFALVGFLDFRGVVADVPGVPKPCEVATTLCEDERNEAFMDRLDEAVALGDDFRSRAWLYGLGALAVVLAGAGVALARTGSARRREVFTDLGVGAVAWLLAGLALVVAGSGGLVDVPSEPIFLPGAALLAVALGGTALTPRSRGSGAAGSAAPQGAGVVRIAGAALTVVALAAAAAILAGRGDPCVEEVPGWVDALVVVALGAAAGAAIAGFVSLAQRRWLAAAAMLALGPFAALFAGLATGCWN